MYDADWNPATDLQATARIYRPGQTKPCYIYRMFTTGTVEEVILQRQIAKGSLTIFDGTKSNEKFTKEEIADCFTLKDESCISDTKRKLGEKWLDYDGLSSLESQGNMDESLIYIAEHNSSRNVLSFVHIVEEKEKEKMDGLMARCGTKGVVLDIGAREASDDDSSLATDEGIENLTLPGRGQNLIDGKSEKARDNNESSDEEMEF